MFFSKIIGVSVSLNDFKKGHDYIDTEKIRVAFHPNQIGYELTKPLHDSVKNDKDKTEDGWSIRNYELYVNNEFYSQMFLLGNRARIISPKWLVNEFQSQIEKMMKNYNRE